MTTDDSALLGRAMAFALQMLAQLSCQLVIVAAESLVFRGRYRNRRTQALKRLRHLDPDRDFGWHFAATVLTAHAAYGVVLGW